MSLNLFRKKQIILLVIFSFGIILNNLFAYDETIVHPSLTEQAAKLYNLNYGDNLSDKEISWIKQGSIDEDKIWGGIKIIRSSNHFYNAFGITQWKDYNLDQKIIPSVFKNIGNGSKIWAHDSIAQSQYIGGDFTWERAIYDYANGDKKHAYESLGHILHLIEDKTVPAHVRNDFHLSPKEFETVKDWYVAKNILDYEPYESWTGNKAKTGALGFDFSDNMFQENKKPIIFNNLDSYFDNVAAYTSTKFFSKDTVYVYLEPKNNTIEGREKASNGKNEDYVYGLDENNQQFKLAKIFTEKDNKGQIVKSYVVSDDTPEIHSDYWSRLAPKSIQAGAGIIKLFKDEVKKAEGEKTVIQKPDTYVTYYFEKPIIKTANTINNTAIAAANSIKSTTYYFAGILKNTIVKVSAKANNLISSSQSAIVSFVSPLKSYYSSSPVKLSYSSPAPNIYPQPAPFIPRVVEGIPKPLAPSNVEGTPKPVALIPKPFIPSVIEGTATPTPIFTSTPMPFTPSNIEGFVPSVVEGMPAPSLAPVPSSTPAPTPDPTVAPIPSETSTPTPTPIFELAFNEVNYGTSVESDWARLGLNDDFFVSDPVDPNLEPTPEPSIEPTPALTPEPSPTIIPEPSASPTPSAEPSPEPSSTPAPSPGRVVISEIGIAGDTPDDEYIELYNAGGTEVDLSGWSIQYRGGQGKKYYSKEFPDGAKIPAHKYFLIARKNDYTGSVSADLEWSQSLSGKGGTVFLVNNNIDLTDETDSGESVVDKVAYGTGDENFLRPETLEFTPASAEWQSIERKANADSTAVSLTSGGVDEYLGNGYDTGNNSADFVLQSEPNPQNSQSFFEPRYAPEKISDLTVSAVEEDARSLKLSWISGGDAHGNLENLRYQFCVTENIILSGNDDVSCEKMWFTYSDMPSVGSSGEKQEYIFQRLFLNKKYYIAIRVADNTDLKSPRVSAAYDIPSSQTLSPWPTYKGNNARTGQSAYNGSQSGHLKWKLKTGYGVASNPSIDYEGNIYFWKGKEGDYRGHGSLVSMSPDTSINWQVSTYYSFENTPAVNPYGHIIYYQDIFDSTRMGDISKFSRSGGMYIGGAKILYGAGSVPSSANSLLSSRDGSVYFIASMANSKLVALEPILSAGWPKIKWERALGGFAAGTPAEDKDKNIYANAAVIIKTKGMIDYEKSFYRLTSFDSSGAVRWQKDLVGMQKNSSFGQFFTPVISDGVGYVNAGNSIYAFNLANGETQKIFSLEGESSEIYYVNSPSVSADGSLYISASDGYLYAIAPEGNLKWRKEIKGIAYRNTSIPSIGSDGTVYIGGENTFYALNPADGSEKWQYLVVEDFPGEKAYAGVPAIAKEGTVYVSFASFSGKNGGQLYAFGD